MKFAGFFAAIAASVLVLGLVPAVAQDVTETSFHDAQTAPANNAVPA